MVETDGVYRINSHVAFRTFGKELVVVDTLGQRLLRLNATGALVFRLLDAGQGLPEVAAAVARAFDTSVEQARIDALSFIEELEKRGLVERRVTT
ncbi:MAG: PqqD family protein [Deltaproteobacteria bacterium]|nr:PqqD family protein [Deltaproteobacteria bacterium]